MPRPSTIARRPRRLVMAGAIVAGLWALSTAAAHWLVVREPVAHPDVLLVMAGAPVYQERIEHAAALARSTASRVVLTNDGQRGRWSRTLQRNPASVERAADALVAAGIPRARIDVLPEVVHGTIDEARALERYAAARDVRSVLVVTSPYHSRRAVWTMRRVTGLGRSVGVDTVPFGDRTPRPATWWTGATGWRDVGLEFVKLAYYVARIG